uniref:Reverse transcriptase zinc-binding domain-containing protein n=1 Tax=Aegilops tauschii subsp. strangulata TaxID=200361 RepID=A0A453NXK5_AEGTS
DHTPLLVNSGEATHIGNKNNFSFELSWFKKADFLEMAAREWARPIAGRSSMVCWQNKIRHLRQFLRGWARNESGIYKQE